MSETFYRTCKVPNVTADFDHLKMLGHVFVVEDAKDLAQIVRDVTRYGGAYRPEVRFLFPFPFSHSRSVSTAFRR